VTDVVQGHRFLTAFTVQGSEGTPAANASFGVPTKAGIVKPQEVRTPYEAVDSNPYRTGEFKSRADAVGSVDFFVFPESGGRLLAAHLGADSVSGSSDPWTHTITNNSSPAWMTFWTQRPLPAGASQWDRFVDCMVKEATLQFNAGQMLNLHCEIISKKARGNLSTPPTVSVTDGLDSTGTAYVWSGATLKYDIDATPAVTARVNLETFDIRFAYPEAEMVLTENLNPDFRDPGLWECGVSATFLVSDWQVFLATYFGSKTAADADQSSTVVRGSWDVILNVAAGGATRTMQIQIPELTFSLEAPDPDVSGKGLRATLTGRLQKPASGQPATIILKNSKSGAY
jgi:tail tube protein